MHFRAQKLHKRLTKFFGHCGLGQRFETEMVAKNAKMYIDWQFVITDTARKEKWGIIKPANVDEMQYTGNDSLILAIKNSFETRCDQS